MDASPMDRLCMMCCCTQPKSRGFQVNKPSKPRKNRLKQLREQSKLTQKEVATILGIDSTTVSSHESARRGITKEEIEGYASLFKVSSYELFFEPETIAD